MSQLNYIGGRWEGELEREDGEKIHLHMSDATLRKHYHAYLESMGVPTPQVSRNMLASLQQIEARQFQAWQHILELEPWLSCSDPDVRILSTLWKKYAARYSEVTPVSSS